MWLSLCWLLLLSHLACTTELYSLVGTLINSMIPGAGSKLSGTNNALKITSNDSIRLNVNKVV